MRFKFLPRSFLLTLSLAVAFFLINFAFDASPVLAISSNDISVNIAPRNPNPNETTTITLSSFAANLDSVLITWSVDGTVSSAGIGKKSFSLQAGTAGSQKRVTVKISMPDGEINKTITIRPSVMTLLWEATDSYVPPFYKGKALLSEGSDVKVVAMPEIRVGTTMANPKNMTYSWKKDYNPDQQASGYGKSFYVYTSDYLERSTNISVVAQTIDQTFSSEASINPASVNPKISFYRRDFSLGTLWDQALTNGHQIVGDDTVVAVPYYISPKEIRTPSLIFRWYINESPVNAKSYFKNIMPLKVEDGMSGTAELRLDIENTDKIFQTASHKIDVQF